MQQDQKNTARPNRRASVRVQAAKARKSIGKCRAKKLDKAVDKRDRLNPHSNHAFALMAYGCGRHSVMLKPVAQVNAYSVPTVVARHLDRYLFKLPTQPFPVRARSSFTGFGVTLQNEVWSDEGIMGLCMSIGRDVKYPDRSPNRADLLQQLGQSVDKVLSPDGVTTALWVEVDQWDRALESQKLFAFCQVAACGGGQALTINLDPSLIEQAVKHPKGAADFLRNRFRDRLKRLIPKPQFAMGIDLNNKGKFHLHGTLVVPDGVDRDRLTTALKSFAGQDLASTVAYSEWSDLPGGFGGYSAKAGAAVAKSLGRRAREVGGRPDQPVMFATQGLIAPAREWWDQIRLENRALLLKLAVQDVASRA